MSKKRKINTSQISKQTDESEPAPLCQRKFFISVNLSIPEQLSDL